MNRNLLIGTAVIGVTGALAATVWAVNKYFPEKIPLLPKSEPLPYPPATYGGGKKWKKDYAVA